MHGQSCCVRQSRKANQASTACEPVRPAARLAARRKCRQLGSTDLSEPILVSCVTADGAIFVRTERSLYRIE